MTKPLSKIEIQKLKIKFANKISAITTNKSVEYQTVKPLYDVYFAEWNNRIGSTNNRILHDFIQTNLLQMASVRTMVFAMGVLDFEDEFTTEFFTDFISF
jgi:hypothetical protein